VLYTGARHTVVNAAVSLLYVFLIGFVNRRCAHIYTKFYIDSNAAAYICYREVAKNVCSTNLPFTFTKSHFGKMVLAKNQR